ncbi:MAG: hypothetical protein OEW60_08705 [Thiovulaceae bacterium]|nr:hypothetical protein [Sulfurimonadaceae bacterium]
MKSNKSFYLGFLTLNLITILQADNLHWEKSLHTIIDTPMLLRTPQALEYQVYEKKFSYFATILHTIKEVNKDGQLDAKIEKSLEEFDQYIVEYLPDCHLGVTVLVETFAG